MSCCEDNVKYNCGERISAACVFYSKYFPKYSKYKDSKNCTTIEETTEEIYKKQEFILNSIDTKELGKKCLEYETTEVDGEEIILVKSILKKFEEKFCEKEDTGGNNEDYSCINCDIDLKCLETNPCDIPNTKKNILQIIIDKLCELEQKIKMYE